MNARCRRPWWAFLLALFSVVVAMLYIDRPRRALAYMAAAAAAFGVWAAGVWAGWSWSIVFVGVGAYGISLIAGVDAFRIARGQRASFIGPWYTRWHALIGIFVLWHVVTFSSVFLLRAYVIEPVRMPSGSMMPTFVVGDYLAVYKWPYGNPGSYGISLSSGHAPKQGAKPARGDLIVFRAPLERSMTYIKRVIGIPGDTVRISGHELFINGEPARRAPLQGEDPLANCTESGVELHEETLAGKTYTIALSQRPPLHPASEQQVPAGYYFVLGDNRDNSRDSRHFGLVPETDIIGRPVVIWFNWNPRQGGARWDRVGVRPR